MAITKRIRVSFDLKVVISSKEEETIKEELVDAFGDDQFGVSNLRFEVKQ